MSREREVETAWVNAASVRGRGALHFLLGRHFAGRDAIEHPDPGGQVVAVGGIELQLAEVEATALVFVVALAAVLVEELRRAVGSVRRRVRRR